jgi:hypothetical protein
MMSKFFNSYFCLISAAIISLIVGLGFLIQPERTPLFLIRCIGIIALIDAFDYALKTYFKYLERKINEEMKIDN